MHKRCTNNALAISARNVAIRVGEGKRQLVGGGGGGGYPHFLPCVSTLWSHTGCMGDQLSPLKTGGSRVWKGGFQVQAHRCNESGCCCCTGL